MKELDLLKKDWNKNENYPKFSEQEIYAMLHKNSSSVVKWIFIISVLELSFGLALGIIMSFTKFDVENTKFLKNIGIYNYYEAFVSVLYIVIVYFIVRFYLMYKQVSTTDSTKKLMINILKARKTVQNYILFNLIAFAVGFIPFFSYVLKISADKASLQATGKIAHISISVYILTFLAILIITGILTTVFWFVYKLLYGFLLKKLKRNFEELKKIDL
ncbi:MAG: hypothetical protein ABI549_10565 [Flavobacterium sp.]|uniref:hypothetical protein n=1 Tax=Flavobacterium sp. TaxID=239 RepID=UPI003264DE1E